MSSSFKCFDIKKHAVSAAFYIGIVLLALLIEDTTGQSDTACQNPQEVSFEIITGYVYTAPADMMDSKPGTLMLTDCIDTCRKNSSCRSINYETGLCVLFSSNADTNEQGQLTPSQFPVFTIYVQKNCQMSNAAKCSAAWSFERVMNYGLNVAEKKSVEVESRTECTNLCLGETEFACRSVMFDVISGVCKLLDMDRQTMAGVPSVFRSMPGTDYLEINCIDEPKRLCIYNTVKGKILKTVDSVYQAIATKEDCEDLCNNAPYRCHSYDFNDTGDNVCRLSHHSAHTLTHIDEPYLAIEEATSYELSACYNVTVECHSGDMTATVHTTTLFGGKMYAKGSPVSCVKDVSNQMGFSIKMAYTDLECGVEKEGPGSYTNDIVIQHHDSIVTSSDLGLSVSCQYDLANKSVSNAVDLGITGAIAPSLFEEAIVDSPNVVMKVINLKGNDTKTAVVGDPLSLVFEIIDQESPYEISVRNLIALDGASNNELLLIDERGCPVDSSIMSEFQKSKENSKVLISSFDAFRFPSTQIVQFRAMVTPCLPVCKPALCNVNDYTGQSKEIESFGRRKKRSLNYIARSKRSSVQLPEDMLLIQTLKIVDRYGRRHAEQESSDSKLSNSFNADKIQIQEQNANTTSNIHRILEIKSNCLDQNSLVAGSVIFVAVQVFLLMIWTFFWRKHRLAQTKSVVGQGSCSTSGSMAYLYDTGFVQRHQ